MSEAASPGAIGPGSRLARALSDDRLTRRAARGDERAFAAIFDRYHQRLYRYCLGIVGNTQDAQDALQNAMVKVLRALPGEERQIELKPWLYRIAHNESIELLRRRRETRELDAELPAPGSGLAGEVASREQLRQLFTDLEQLPERQRGALVMRELSGLDFEEIAAALGTSPAVARQTLYEARLSLRQMDEGREMSCEGVTRALSDGDGRVTRRRDLRAHLRTCADCRRFGEEIDGRQRNLAALSPLPAVAAAGLLQGLLGGHGGGGGVAAVLGGGAAKSLGATAALKGAATVAVVAAIGVGAADRGGLIDAGLPGGGGSQGDQVQAPASPGAAGGAGAQQVSGSQPAPGKKARDGGAGKNEVGGAQAAQGGGAPSDAREVGAETRAAAIPAPSSDNTAASPHPHGKGHAKQHPAAAAHGQETAAAHKAAGQGSAAAGSGNASPPATPAQPVPAPVPGKEKAAKSPSPGGEPEAEPPAATAPPPAAEAPPGAEAGKKP
jgi:RNA polymerase sigma factor (sigma-70 family)